MENQGHLERCSPKAVGIGCLISLKLFCKGFSTASPWIAGALMGFFLQYFLIACIQIPFLGYEKVLSAQFIEAILLFTVLTSSITYFFGAVALRDQISFDRPLGLVLWAGFAFIFGLFLMVTIFAGLFALLSVIYLMVKFSQLFVEPIQWLMALGFIPDYALDKKSFPAFFYLCLAVIASGYFMIRSLLLTWCEIGQSHFRSANI